jgi:hypothetical protein
MDMATSGSHLRLVDAFCRCSNGRLAGGGMTGQFEELTENERIVMSDQFADENGRAISATGFGDR